MFRSTSADSVPLFFLSVVLGLTTLSLLSESQYAVRIISLARPGAPPPYILVPDIPEPSSRDGRGQEGHSLEFYLCTRLAGGIDVSK